MQRETYLQNIDAARPVAPPATEPLQIFDTTLRDGEQAPGNAMTIAQKVTLARTIADLGVDTLEAGFPAASAIDFDAVKLICNDLRETKISVLARARADDIELASRALENAKHGQILLLATASDIHLKSKRGLSREAALEELENAVKLSLRLGSGDVSVGVEDATRADRSFLRTLCDTATSLGARTIVIADTVGCMVPTMMTDLISEVRAWLPSNVLLSVHTHDDLGLAVANTMAAVHAGAGEVHATLCGIGERAGNASLEEIIACLYAHPSYYRRSVRLRSEGLHHACNQLVKMLRLPLPGNKAIIGENAFSSAAGIHQAAMLKNLKTYEFLDPEHFGASRTFYLSRHSGHHAIDSLVDGDAQDDLKNSLANVDALPGARRYPVTPREQHWGGGVS